MKKEYRYLGYGAGREHTVMVTTRRSILNPFVLFGTEAPVTTRLYRGKVRLEEPFIDVGTGRACDAATHLDICDFLSNRGIT